MPDWRRLALLAGAPSPEAGALTGPTRSHKPLRLRMKHIGGTLCAQSRLESKWQENPADIRSESTLESQSEREGAFCQEPCMSIPRPVHVHICCIGRIRFKRLSSETWLALLLPNSQRPSRETLHLPQQCNSMFSR